MKACLAEYSCVLITGASSGIGACIARLLFNIHPKVRICNFSRSIPEVNLIQLGLKHIVCDLEKPHELEAAVEAFKAWRLQEGITEGKCLLINNSGFGDIGLFPGQGLQMQLGMVDVNMRVPVHLTTLLLPLIVETKGGIINVSSAAGFQPTPFLATYGAAKAFMLHWSLALSVELEDRGVRVMALCPARTQSKFFERADPNGKRKNGGNYQGLPAEVVARTCLESFAAGKLAVVPGFRNKLRTLFMGCLPRVWAVRVAWRALKRR
ncbi:MAG: hypothetical protein B7X06_03225 [Verrucomicrobia bacterium 21-51-4]|nr:MAG: hypothetical protein B7X06_03225 [Verrucomicrobia bacterium 21-51-4]